VKLRYFAGITIDEAVDVLGISVPYAVVGGRATLRRWPAVVISAPARS